MIETRDGEHPNDVKECGDRDGGPTPAYPDHAEAAEMKEKKRNATTTLELFGAGADGFGAFRKIVGIKPLADGDADAGEP